jgi:hypothetical protein
MGKPWFYEHRCIPEVSPAFVAAMEDVLDLYAEPYDPDRAWSASTSGHCNWTRTLLATRPGRGRRLDYE